MGIVGGVETGPWIFPLSAHEAADTQGQQARSPTCRQSPNTKHVLSVGGDLVPRAQLTPLVPGLSGFERESPALQRHPPPRPRSQANQDPCRAVGVVVGGLNKWVWVRTESVW